MLDRLREAGHITHPSPLLAPLLEKLPEVFAAEVLTRMDPTERAMCSRVGVACRAVAGGYTRPLFGST